MKNKIITILISTIIIESFFIGFVLLQYNKGFFIKYYFNEANGSTKIVYKQGNIKLWEDLTPPLLDNKKEKWIVVHTRGTISSEYDARSYTYWTFLEVCEFYMSPETSIEIKKRYLDLLGKNPQEAYSYVDKVLSDFRKRLLALKLSCSSDLNQ